MKILPYPQHLEPAVARFNQRLKAGGQEAFLFPESCTSRELPKVEGAPVWRDYFVAADDDLGEVRGGYIIRGQAFMNSGRPFELPFLKLPVSEGVIDRDFAFVGVSLLQDVIGRFPSVYALGMGGVAKTLPRLLARLGWWVGEVPFFFKIRNARPLPDQLSAFRDRDRLRVLFRLAAWSGLAFWGTWLAFPPARTPRGFLIEEMDGFGPWADEVWEAASKDYGLLGERSARTLPLLYRNFQPALRVIRVRDPGDRLIGWLACLVTRMRSHPQFGDLTVATLVDGMARLPDVADLIAAGTSFLESHRPDLIVSNQAHPVWGRGLRQCGFRRGPSNFAWAISPEARRRLGEANDPLEVSHLNRGDGDGPIHL